MKTREPRGRRVSQWKRHFGVLVLLIAGVAAPLTAQQEASIVGVVSDESGAALPGVAVTATPGSAAPLSSVTTPTMLASCCALTGAAIPASSSTSAPKCRFHCDTRRPRDSRAFICTSASKGRSPYDPLPGAESLPPRPRLSITSNGAC